VAVYSKKLTATVTLWNAGNIVGTWFCVTSSRFGVVFQHSNETEALEAGFVCHWGHDSVPWMRSDSKEKWFVTIRGTMPVELVFASLLAAGSGKTGWTDSRCFPCQRFQKRDQQGDFREALAT